MMLGMTQNKAPSSPKKKKKKKKKKKGKFFFVGFVLVVYWRLKILLQLKNL